MASYNTQPQAHQHHHAASFNTAVSMGSSAPAGTFVPGTKVQVGNHRVVIEKYLSEGGFAHVYVVKLAQPIDGAETAVLKRVAVPDKTSLAGMRTEVETMKKLKGHRHIVKYMDSHASQLKGGGYEVFLLMENCQGGGLIDFMNTRLQHRLTEPEIIKIFSDVAEGVACMHYLKPPLLHRDLKVENVLISLTGKNPVYKLCDFGSTAPPRPAAKSGAEGRLIEDDIQKHTTMQYRSPEMIDVYRKQPIDEKSDIWALGVLLYKLCYYTTPFEEVGQMAILNASYKFPSYPTFSGRLKRLIGKYFPRRPLFSTLTNLGSMLQENPQRRPTIYEALKEACSMQGKDVPIRDVWNTFFYHCCYYCCTMLIDIGRSMRSEHSLKLAASKSFLLHPPRHPESALFSPLPCKRRKLFLKSHQCVAAAQPSRYPSKTLLAQVPRRIGARLLMIRSPCWTAGNPRVRVPMNSQPGSLLLINSLCYTRREASLTLSPHPGVRQSLNRQSSLKESPMHWQMMPLSNRLLLLCCPRKKSPKVNKNQCAHPLWTRSRRSRRVSGVSRIVASHNSHNNCKTPTLESRK
jgi:serine/threonine protein kinase